MNTNVLKENTASIFRVKNGEAYSFEAFVTMNQATWHHIPEDKCLNIPHCQNIKSQFRPHHS
jgi:hypothetical protein